MCLKVVDTRRIAKSSKPLEIAPELATIRPESSAPLPAQMNGEIRVPHLRVASSSCQ